MPRLASGLRVGVDAVGAVRARERRIRNLGEDWVVDARLAYKTIMINGQLRIWSTQVYV